MHDSVFHIETGLVRRRLAGGLWRKPWPRQGFFQETTSQNVVAGWVRGYAVLKARFIAI